MGPPLSTRCCSAALSLPGGSLWPPLSPRCPERPCTAAGRLAGQCPPGKQKPFMRATMVPTERRGRQWAERELGGGRRGRSHPGCKGPPVSGPSPGPLLQASSLILIPRKDSEEEFRQAAKAFLPSVLLVPPMPRTLLQLHGEPTRWGVHLWKWQRTAEGSLGPLPMERPARDQPRRGPSRSCRSPEFGWRRHLLSRVGEKEQGQVRGEFPLSVPSCSRYL